MSYAGGDGGNVASAAPLISSVVDAVSRIPKCCGLDQVFNSSAGWVWGIVQPSHLSLLNLDVEVPFQDNFMIFNIK